MKSNFSPLDSGLLLVLLALVVLAAAAPAGAQTVSPFMAYQGYLADGGGNPLGAVTNGGPKDYDVVFRLWSAQSGGAEIYAEEQTVTVNNGYFSVLLGSGGKYTTEPYPSFPSVWTTNSSLFVELSVQGVAVGGGAYTILPRQLVLPSAYAFVAQSAVTANAAAYVSNLCTLTSLQQYTQVVSVAGGNVILWQPANVSGTLAATNLVLGNPSVLTNTVLAANGSAAFGGLNVAGPVTTATLVVTNPVTVASLTASGAAATANVNVAGTAGINSLVVGSNAVAGTASVNGTFNIAALTASNLISATTLSCATGRCGTLTFSNSLSAPSATVAGGVNVNTTSHSMPATGGDEDLRLVFGTVNSSGVPVQGAGDFIVTQSSDYYTVTFSKAFSAPPVVVVTPVWGTSEDNSQSPVLFSVGAGSFMVSFIDWSDWGDGVTSQQFEFLAVGPR